MKTLATATLGACLLAGCVSYRASIQKDVRRGDFDVRVEEATGRRGNQSRLTLVMQRVAAEVRLARASLSADSGSVCEGIEATRMGREGGRPADAPLANGEWITLEFSGGGLQTMAAKGAHLDLLVRTSQGKFRCVSLPLEKEGRPLEWEALERFGFGIDLSLEGYPSELGPVSQIVTFPVEFGVWAGRVRFDVAAGIAGAGCPETHCAAPSQDQKINYANSWPILAGARMPLYESGEWSFGAGLHYRGIRLAADTFAGHEAFWAHGAVFAPYVGAAAPVAKDGSGMGGAREGLIALEVPIGYAVAENGRHSLSVGVNLAWMFPAF